MLAVSIDDLPLSKREKAALRRGESGVVMARGCGADRDPTADLVNAAQLLYASPSDNASIRLLFETTTHFEQLQEKAAYAQAPKPYSVLQILESTRAGSILASYEEETTSDGVTGKRKCEGGKDDHPTLVSSCLTVSTGDDAIDTLLGGGLRRGCLTEIVGERSVVRRLA